ncbi:uncharacterized protein MONBRDRAFT_27349 [Monosiga brevicollis MX1]|uniref:SH2 domain-containing protein n=1 Tax=Monosiga brevicollis TaxID=81824 RepID=A9V512_MONBE|nr:uncharacterized protein MONBRDRAFT_27349 [Monosiga brevicollis MX1]EDQ87195.1 predicted protein [Monosiga brevicollis MX1]|eukprot:XP_001747808.1 hypothetical protein [Monosiga brevicollis MX1]
MSGRIFPWFHGKLSRDEVESRLKAVCAGRDYDDVVYLVREKSDSDRDLVLSWMNVKTQSATHFVVKMMGAGRWKGVPATFPRSKSFWTTFTFVRRRSSVTMTSGTMTSFVSQL